MTDKAYIVANEQQEMAVLRELEEQGYTWKDKRKATGFMPSEKACVAFPYTITGDKYLGWLSIDDAVQNNYEIAFDGRKEKKMSEKYVVSQEFMDKLEKWKEAWIGSVYVDGTDLDNLPLPVCNWWLTYRNTTKETNNRLIAIIRWVNGEPDVFEVEKPKKWVVRSKNTNEKNEYWYIALTTDKKFSDNGYELEGATRFDTKEEAESWANSHQEVVQMEDE